MSFMEDVENFLQNPGKHASHPRFGEMKETIEFMKNNAKGFKNTISTDKIVEHLNSKGYDISKEDWQINIKGYLWDEGIFIGSIIPKGMFLIESMEDVVEACNSMENRIEKENERIRRLKDRANELGYNLD